MKKIFILGNIDSTTNYHKALSACGAQVIFGQSACDAWDCDALLLTGGSDVNPQLYGEENTNSEDIDDTRDRVELELIDFFAEQNKPILGICRGLQVLNIAFGGSLIQHIAEAACHSRCGDPVDKVHRIVPHGESFLTALYGNTFSVNSSHHQAIHVPATVFSIAAYSDDGIAEAIVHKTRPIFAVQWHPERMAAQNSRADAADGGLLFRYFLSRIQ